MVWWALLNITGKRKRHSLPWLCRLTLNVVGWQGVVVLTPNDLKSLSIVGKSNIKNTLRNLLLVKYYGTESCENHMIRCRNFLLAWFGMWFGFGVFTFYDSWFVIRIPTFLIYDSDSWFGLTAKIRMIRIRDSVTILFRIIWFGKWFGVTNTESYFSARKDSV